MTPTSPAQTKFELREKQILKNYRSKKMAVAQKHRSFPNLTPTPNRFLAYKWNGSQLRLFSKIYIYNYQLNNLNETYVNLIIRDQKNYQTHRKRINAIKSTSNNSSFYYTRIIIA